MIEKRYSITRACCLKRRHARRVKRNKHAVPRGERLFADMSDIDGREVSGAAARGRRLLH